MSSKIRSPLPAATVETGGSDADGDVIDFLLGVFAFLVVLAKEIVTLAIKHVKDVTILRGENADRNHQLGPPSPP